MSASLISCSNEATDVVEAILATTTTANAKSSMDGMDGDLFLGHFRAGRHAPE